MASLGEKRDLSMRENSPLRRLDSAKSPARAAPAHGRLPDAPLAEQDLHRLLGWFIRIRWLFVGGLVLAVLVGAHLFHLELQVARPLAVAAVIGLYNAAFALHHRRQVPPDGGRPAAERLEAGLQIGLDLLALTVLIHWVGGATSPLVCLYLVHAIAGVMLFPRRDAWLVGAGTFGLFLALSALEEAGLLPRYRISGLTAADGEQTTFAVVLALILLVTLGASMVIASTIMGGLRLRERQLRAAYESLSEQQQQLVQTEKHASLGRLVAGIAHEINNPIQFIHGNMSLLSEALSDALPLLDEQSARRPGLRIARLDYPYFRKQAPVLLKDMEEGAERIGLIVRELRTFARGDEGRLDEPVDLAEVVRGSVRLLHNQLKHVHLEVELDPALPIVPGNLAQMQQVVVNTLQNACEALPGDGSGRIAVHAHPTEDGSWVRLTVEDNGCGIPAEIRGRIFDPFFTTKHSSGGTGLGLAIIDGIIEQHRGQVEVESEVGRGTMFVFLLPAKGAPAA